MIFHVFKALGSIYVLFLLIYLQPSSSFPILALFLSSFHFFLPSRVFLSLPISILSPAFLYRLHANFSSKFLFYSTKIFLFWFIKRFSENLFTTLIYMWNDLFAYYSFIDFSELLFFRFCLLLLSDLWHL